MEGAQAVAFGAGVPSQDISLMGGKHPTRFWVLPRHQQLDAKATRQPRILPRIDGPVRLSPPTSDGIGVTFTPGANPFHIQELHVLINLDRETWGRKIVNRGG